MDEKGKPLFGEGPFKAASATSAAGGGGGGGGGGDGDRRSSDRIRRAAGVDDEEYMELKVLELSELQRRGIFVSSNQLPERPAPAIMAAGKMRKLGQRRENFGSRVLLKKARASGFDGEVDGVEEEDEQDKKQNKKLSDFHSVVVKAARATKGEDLRLARSHCWWSSSSLVVVVH